MEVHHGFFRKYRRICKRRNYPGNCFGGNHILVRKQIDHLGNYSRALQLVLCYLLRSGLLITDTFSMSKYKFLYLYWLIPAFLLFLVLHQVSVYYGVIDTYENGDSYTAEVLEFELKQIAAQTNGYVILRFQPDGADEVEQKLSLPIEMAGQVADIRVIPIRYQEGARQNIVMMPTYSTQKNLVVTNIAMAALGFLITFIIGIGVNRYTGKKLKDNEPELVFERVDSDE